MIYLYLVYLKFTVRICTPEYFAFAHDLYRNVFYFEVISVDYDFLLIINSRGQNKDAILQNKSKLNYK